MSDALEERFERHALEWRDPLAVAAQWSDAAELEPGIFDARESGRFWEQLERLDITLVVSREYEHLLMALSTVAGKPYLTYLRLPHPSGLAFDAARDVLHAASTRNPNQLYEFAPVIGTLARGDDESANVERRPLVPVRSRYFPGCFYIHDIALVGADLYANSVGQNAVVRLNERGSELAWWPACVDRDSAPDTRRNYIQLNSIAAGSTVEASFFSASGDTPGVQIPGDPDYPVDRRGVVFSGDTRRPMMRSLTRPHSARLHCGRVWVDNSGYGQLVVSASNDGYDVVTDLPGWTRGLAFAGDIAFVGTSRILPRFRQYAPGLHVEASRCAVAAVDTTTGSIVGALEFPAGNQIFAIEAVPATWSKGFPFVAGSRDLVAERRLFYGYVT